MTFVKKHVNLWLKKHKPEIIIHLAAMVVTKDVNKNKKGSKYKLRWN